MREAVTAARFSHPNVVAVYDVEESPEGAYIAMELVEGISLERLLLQRGRLRPAEVIPLGAAIARGLAAAHARDIVHRDVKPANVMLGRDGSIKVTDFGIADLIAASVRADGLVFGTPGYLPPEALRGAGHNRAGDLFALGVVLYECLAGVKPFGGGHRRLGHRPGHALRRHPAARSPGRGAAAPRARSRSCCNCWSATTSSAPPTPPPWPTSSTIWPRPWDCAGSWRRGRPGPPPWSFPSSRSRRSGWRPRGWRRRSEAAAGG